MAISLVNVFKYYKEQDHQKKAVQILQRQIESTNPEWLADASEFVKSWRNADYKSSFPLIQVNSDGTQMTAEWLGKKYTLAANQLKVRVLDAPDRETGNTVAKEMSGKRFVSNGISVDTKTGNIAVGVLLDTFADTDTSAVFIIDPQPGKYTSYPLRLPGSQPLPNDSSTYGMRTIKSVRFLDENLLVKHGDASGAEAMVLLKPSNTSAMAYAGCIDINIGEGSGICSLIAK